jgi:hypothetical protein
MKTKIVLLALAVLAALAVGCAQTNGIRWGERGTQCDNGMLIIQR